MYMYYLPYIYIQSYIYIYICLEALYNPQKFLALISGSNQAHKAVVVMPMIGVGGGGDAGMPGIQNWHCIWMEDFFDSFC